MSTIEKAFAAGDRVKISSETHEFHNQIGEVSFANRNHVWVKFPSSPLSSISFKNDAVSKLKHPAKGDRVRIQMKGLKWDQHEGTVQSVFGQSVRVLLDANDSDPANFHLREVEVFDPAPVRVEGEQIAYEDVKKGDLIETLSFQDKSGVKHKTYTEGVVDAISLQNNQLRSRQGVVIYDATKHTGIKLIKSADNDETLTALKDFPVGAILSYYEGGAASNYLLRVAVKRSESHWGHLAGTSGQMLTTETLRAYLKDAADSYTILDS
jgi:hypothetical protein